MADNLLVVQPYTPLLPGPHILMELWRGELLPSRHHGGVGEAHTSRPKWNTSDELPLRCSACTEREGNETMMPLKEFAGESRWSKSVGLGAYATCASCARFRATKLNVASHFGQGVRNKGVSRGFGAKRDLVRCVACDMEKPEADFG
ncbi:hypothetical protein N9L68_00345 [bacterium]|nr:hypothetical protein [bacterium]